MDRNDEDDPSDFPVGGDEESDEVQWLRCVQDSQDQGESWGHAIECADINHPL